jgi:hypothetical protein
MEENKRKEFAMFKYLQAVNAFFKPSLKLVGLTPRGSPSLRRTTKLELEALENRLVPALILPSSIRPQVTHSIIPAQVHIAEPISVAVAGSASRLTVVSQPVSVKANAAFSLVVEVVNVSGQVVSSFNGQVTVTLAQGFSRSNAGGPVTVSAVAGVATFNGLTFSQPGDFVLVISSNGVPSTKVGPIVVAGSSAKVQPSAISHGQSLQPSGPSLLCLSGALVSTDDGGVVDDAAGSGTDSNDTSDSDD